MGAQFGKFCTEAEVQLMVSRAIIDYDERVNAPRHKENQNILKRLDNSQEQVKGGITVLKWIGTVATVLVGVVGLVLTVHWHQ